MIQDAWQQINYFNFIFISMQRQQVTQHEYFTKYLCPANPIITKNIEIDQQAKIAMKKNQLPTVDPIIQNSSKKINKNMEQDSVSQQYQLIDRLTLMNNYQGKPLVYKKCNNKEYWQRNKKKYFASIFTNLLDWPENDIHSIQCNGLKFTSQGQSMNLFAVFQTGANQYDLILQNDINTCGYTQWYYFSVTNKNKFQTVKFNIVNLYKSKSLYSSGMKPLVFSKKAGKGWQRGGTNIIYGDNEINVEYSHRLYRTLSFQYTFLQENNQTLFAHCYPYTYTSLKQKLKSFQKNPRVKLRVIGTTCMKKNIPLVQFSQEDSNTNKKSIIIMARQHPGETVGSLIMDQILTQLTRPTTQNEFLLWKFNIYCIPMVNIDGVILGNYRGNAFGFDLNRCWDRQNINKIPQIVHIKKQIRKIHKKNPIQLILDLHGHSRKMGSFFYGNPFGKNTCLYALVASNQSTNISFENSTFNKQRSQKVTTARIILGNIIKDTGCFYTYQTSFYGSVVNNKKVHFGLENFQQLGRVLINSAYKTFVQLHKEQKTLKQSLFLKEVRKQLTSIQSTNFNEKDDSGSDSQAELITMRQFTIKNLQQLRQSPNKKQKSLKNQEEQIQRKSIEIQVGESRLDDLNEEAKQETINHHTDVQTSVKKQRLKKDVKLIKIQSMSEKHSLFVGFQRSEDLTNNSSNPNDNVNRKNYLLQKLRVFGQTFIQQNPKQGSKQTSKQTQTGNFPLNIQGLSKKMLKNIEKNDQLLKSPCRRRKNRNKSLIIRLDNKQKIGMADIVKINRLEYKRIQRNSIIESHRRDIQLKNILPSIN